jgi:hypothetical protein
MNCFVRLIGCAAMLAAGVAPALAQQRGSASVQQCLISGLHCPGCEDEVHIQVRKGTVCGVALSSGLIAGVGFSVTQKPTLGEAGIRDSYTFTYRSFRAGTDRFQVRRDGFNSLGKPYTSLLNVNVRVTE